MRRFFTFILFALFAVTAFADAPVTDGGTVLRSGSKRLSEGRKEYGTPILNKIPYINRLFMNTAIVHETSSYHKGVVPQPETPVRYRLQSLSSTDKPEIRFAGRRNASDDYVLESPDVITIRFRCDGSLSPKAVEQINGEHLIGPDGHITLGPLGRFSVQNKTLAGVETEIRDRLNKHPRVEKFRLHVDLFSSNSKEYYVIIRSAEGGEQAMAFPCTGKETVLKAIANINGLPPGSENVKMWLVRQENNMALPAVMPIDWKAITAFGDPKTNYTLQPNDRIMIVEKEPVFRPHVTARDFMLESAQRKRDVENLRKQEPPVAARDPGTKIARSVFFDGEAFDHEILATLITIRADLPEYREQSPYAFANIDGVAFSAMMTKESADFWLIIYGDAEKVVELQRMFMQIAEEGKALLKARRKAEKAEEKKAKKKSVAPVIVAPAGGYQSAYSNGPSAGNASYGSPQPQVYLTYPGPPVQSGYSASPQPPSHGYAPVQAVSCEPCDPAVPEDQAGEPISKKDE